MSTYLDNFYGQFDVEAVQRQIDEARDQVRGAQERLNAAEASMAAYQAWQAVRTDDSASSNGRHTAGSVPDASPLRPVTSRDLPPTGRRALLALIDATPGRTWSIPSVAGTLGLSHEAHHAIGVSLSRLAREGKIARPSKGVYTKLAASADAAPRRENREMN